MHPLLGSVPLGSDTACHKIKMFRFTVRVDFLPLIKLQAYTIYKIMLYF